MSIFLTIFLAKLAEMHAGPHALHCHETSRHVPYWWGLQRVAPLLRPAKLTKMLLSYFVNTT